MPRGGTPGAAPAHHRRQRAADRGRAGRRRPHRFGGTHVARPRLTALERRRRCRPRPTTCACAGREIHYTEWGAQHADDGDRLARPGAHRARHGRSGRAAGAALPRDLPRHDRPRPEPVEPGPGARVLPGVLRAGSPTRCVDRLGIERFHWLGTSMGGAIGTLRRGRRACAGASGAWCSTTTARGSRARRWSASAAMPATRRRSTPWRARGVLPHVYKPYGWLSDAQWRRLTETSTRRLPEAA